MDRLIAPRHQHGNPLTRPGEGPHRQSALILELLRGHGSATRPFIARETGLSRAVVTQRLGELQAGGLIVERGNDASSGGRPPRQVAFNADRGHVLVADLGATSLTVAVADLLGRVRHSRTEASDIAAGPDIILGRIEALFDAIRAESNDVPGLLWGIGVSLPGPVEFTTGRPVAPPIMPGWENYPVRERLAERFGVPVWVDNDVNVMALGERAEGIARGVDDFVFIKVGTGIGSGIIAHGRLLRGAEGSAGDVGHIQVVADSSVVCRCGNVGCLEAVAGGAALGRSATQIADEGGSPVLAELLERRGTLSAREVAEASLHGDRASTQLLQRAGRHIGQMLATMVNILNPSLLVIGGGVAESGDVLMASVREVVYGRSLPLATRHLQIRRSALGDQAGAIGLATMVLDELFATERIASWLNGGLASGRPAFVTY